MEKFQLRQFLTLLGIAMFFAKAAASNPTAACHILCGNGGYETGVNVDNDYISAGGQSWYSYPTRLDITSRKTNSSTPGRRRGKGKRRRTGCARFGPNCYVGHGKK